MIDLRHDGKLYASLTQPPLDIILDNEDLMEAIVRCPNCGQATPFGETRMICGYIGCDNIFNGGNCYFDDLMPRVLLAKETEDPRYKNGPMYSIEEDRDA